MKTPPARRQPDRRDVLCTSVEAVPDRERHLVRNGLTLAPTWGCSP